MTSEQFQDWATIACSTMGGGERFSSVLLSNERVIIEDWCASAGELGDCVYRLVAGGRVPQWPNELTNAIHRELVEVRHKKRMDEAPQAEQVATCQVCGGGGMLVVPHPRCVWQGRIVNYYNPLTGLRYPYAISVSVVCCGVDCRESQAIKEYEREQQQRRGKKRTLTSEEYERIIGYADGVALWREYMTNRAAEARRLSPRSTAESNLFDRMIDGIKERATP